MKNKIIDKIKLLNIYDSELWIKEAEFGFTQVSRYCKNIDTQSNVLEIGCGSGILLSMLTNKFNSFTFDGIEPLYDGYKSLSELNKIINDTDVKIKHVAYEAYKTNKKYDLIYCINVFEHVDDWRHFLITVSGWLNKNGKILILAPNYSFPYESHFNIPILINKLITYNVFKTLIDKHEKKYNNKGLWDSLNFVKKTEVNNFIKKKSYLTLIDDTSIIDIMINRAINDNEFRSRQKFLSLIAVIIKKTGALKILKLFSGMLPYMKLEISKHNNI